MLCLTTPTIAKLVADGRLELPTTALSEQCSTTELIGNGRRTIGQIKIGSIAPHERMAFFCQSHLPAVEVDILPRFETCATFFEIATHVF